VQIQGRLRQQTIASDLSQALAGLELARNEQARFGRDLHDGAIQSLYAVQLSLGRAVQQTQRDLPDTSQQLAECREGMGTIIGELRQFIVRHESETAPGADLERVLRTLAEKVRLSAGVDCKLHSEPGAARSLSDEQAVQIANIAREALSNSIRHAQGTRIEISFARNDHDVILEVADNGCGFDSESRSIDGMGLKSMKIRANEAGGELFVISSRNHGTKISAVIPVKEANAAGYN
jgi:signal transduction histidine kinase